MQGNMFFSGWEPIGRTIVIGGIVYAAVVLFLRISGKRTLSKMNAFDLVVTIALGSTVSAAFVSKDVDVTQSVIAVGYLIALQFVVAWASSRSKTFLRIIKSEPALLVAHGEFLQGTMLRERISEPEIVAAIRESGHSKVEQVAAVVLETDGTLTVLGSLDSMQDSAMDYVKTESGQASS